MCIIPRTSSKCVIPLVTAAALVPLRRFQLSWKLVINVLSCVRLYKTDFQNFNKQKELVLIAYCFYTFSYSVLIKQFPNIATATTLYPNMVAKKKSIPVIRMTELMSQCQSWLPDPSVHSSSNFTTKQWYQKWIMGGLWDGSRRVICQKKNYYGEKLWE